MPSITVPGEPISQPRQRHAMIAGHVRNYTPSKHPVNDYKAGIKLAWHSETCGEHPPLTGPVGVTMVFVFSRPKSKRWKSKPMPRYPHTGKPDAENCAKAVLDALSKLAFVDDAQVSELMVQKWVAAGDEAPRTEVFVECLSSRVR